MGKKNIFLLAVYSISFIMTWLCFIFWIDKIEFDLEFGDKISAVATVSEVGTDQVVEELYEGRKTNVYEVNCLKYYYSVNGKKYASGGDYSGREISVLDKIGIEYVKSNPAASRIKGQNEYSHNYFIRKLIPVSAVSLVVMICLLWGLDFFPKLRTAVEKFQTG